MKHSTEKQTDISMDLPTLSNQVKKQVDQKRHNTVPPVKKTSVTFIMISSLVTSLSVVAVTVATAKFWRPKLFPELGKISTLEKDILALNQEILSLQGETQNKELLSNELASLKLDIDKTKTDIKVEMEEVNKKINTVASEQKNKEMTQEPETVLEGDSTVENHSTISMDAGVFYAQFLTAIEENKPLSTYFEQAEKISLSDKFKDLINNIRKINFDKLKSDEELMDHFNQMHSEILKDTMLTTKVQIGKKKLIDSIKDNIQITKKNHPNRAQLKSDFIMAKRLFDKDDLEGAIDILAPYTNHKNVALWIKHAQERIDHEDAVQNVRNFKGPYSK